MKKITLMLFALIAGTTFAQSTDSGTATVNAEIVEPITISDSASDLDFGLIASPTAATDIVVSTDGSRTPVTGVTMPGGTISAASFTIKAADGYAYSIALPTDFKLSIAGGGPETMPVVFESSLGTSSTGTGLDQVLNVGGTLKLGASQTAGKYTGEATITVAYE